MNACLQKSGSGRSISYQVQVYSLISNALLNSSCFFDPSFFLDATAIFQVNLNTTFIFLQSVPTAILLPMKNHNIHSRLIFTMKMRGTQLEHNIIPAPSLPQGCNHSSSTLIKQLFLLYYLLHFSIC